MIRTEHRGVGAARATGLAAVRGTYVAYCDDDDVWTPDHLRHLLAFLRANPEVALVYGDGEWVPPAVRPLVSPRDDGSELANENYIFASDVLHRAAPVRAVGGFDPNLRIYEDWDLWLRLNRCYPLRRLPRVVTFHHHPVGRVAATPDPKARAYLIAHEQPWRRRVERAARFRGTTGDPPPFDPATWSPDRRRLLWQSSLHSARSFAAVARRLLVAVERRGVDVTIGPVRAEPPPAYRRFYGPMPPRDRLGFHYDWMVGPAALGCERVVHYGMWESTAVPCYHVAEINRAVSLLYVPCRQNAESFAACGVRRPIKILHHGVDPTEFPLLERPVRDRFTFGSFGDLASPRKGIDVLLRAFRDEFTRGEPVRLLLKRTYADRNEPLERAAATDRRIELVSGVLGRGALLRLLRRMDAFVLPSRGEGFGLGGLEAMATGLPTIATDWSGPTEYLDPADSFPLAYRLIDAIGTPANQTRYFGRWAEPDVEHLRALLRWLFEHPVEARAMGRRAAARVHADWDWDRAGAQIVADLDALAGGISPV